MKLLKKCIWNQSSLEIHHLYLLKLKYSKYIISFSNISVWFQSFHLIVTILPSSEAFNDILEIGQVVLESKTLHPGSPLVNGIQNLNMTWKMYSVWYQWITLLRFFKQIIDSKQSWFLPLFSVTRFRENVRYPKEITINAYCSLLDSALPVFVLYKHRGYQSFLIEIKVKKPKLRILCNVFGTKLVSFYIDF